MKRGVCISDKFNHKPYYYAAPTLTEVYSQCVYKKKDEALENITTICCKLKKLCLIKCISDKFNYKPYYYAAPTLTEVYSQSVYTKDKAIEK